MSPRVTVICPMYNVGDYVADCIASLKAQHYTDFEVIMVDDASSDGTLEIARAAAGDDQRFVFLEQEHAGQSAARNLAFEHVRGEYVLNLDSDDEYVPQTIARLMEFADAHKLDAVFFGARTSYETNELARTHYEPHTNRVGEMRVIDGFDMLVHFHKTDSFRPSPCMYLLRASIMRENDLHFLEGIIHEDLLFTLKVFPYIKSCVFLAEPLYVRRMRPGSTMTKPRSLDNVHGLFTATRMLEAFMAEHGEHWPAVYIDAYCKQIYDAWHVLAQDVLTIGDEKIEAYRERLDPLERAAFDLRVYEPGHYLGYTRDYYATSTSYRLGQALLAVPMWVKDRLWKPDYE